MDELAVKLKDVQIVPSGRTAGQSDPPSPTSTESYRTAIEHDTLTAPASESCSSLECSIAESYHPDFDGHWPDETDHVIIQSHHGVNFRCSLSVLVEHSGFFRDMVTLPSRATTIADTVMELPSATTEGLRVFLTLVHPLKSSDWIIAVSLDLDSTDFCSLVQASCELADAYDIPILLPLLVTAIDHDPFLSFALAAVAKDEELAKAASTRTIDLNINEMSMSARAILESLAPDYLERLDELHQHRRKLWEKVIFEIRYGQPMTNGFMDFGKNCRKRNGCSAMTFSSGDFHTLRRRCADVVLPVMEGKYDNSAYVAMRGAVDRLFSCQACRTRIGRAFGNVLIYRWYGKTMTI